MKTFNAFLLCCLLGLFAFVSCNEEATSDEGGGNTPINNISVGDAKSWAAAWKVDITGTNLTPIQGFTLPDVDLAEVLDEAGVDSVRFYLGKDSLNEIHLMVVGVDSSGNDLYDSKKQQYIYDFSKPCPTDCGSLVD